MGLCLQYMPSNNNSVSITQDFIYFETNEWVDCFFINFQYFLSIFQIGYEKSSTAQQKETPLSLLLNIPNCKTPQAKKLYYNTLISAILRSSMKTRDLISSAGSDVENSPIFLLQ